MNTAARWNRLADTFADADVPMTTLQSTLGGQGFCIGRRVNDAGDRIEIHDKWWRKNHDVWIGYQVHIEDREGIVRREWPITKKRSEVVAAVREALGLVA